MRPYIVSVILLLVNSFAWSQGTWVKTYGGTKGEAASEVVAVSDNGCVMAGTTYSGDGLFQRMQRGNGDIFVMKVDKSGETVWVSTFGGSMLEEATALVTAANGDLIVAGQTSSNDGDFSGQNRGDWDVFVVRLDSNGSLLWKTTLGGSGRDAGTSLSLTYDGGIALAGYTNSVDGDFQDLNRGQSDLFVAKLDSNGHVAWHRCYGGKKDDYAQSIVSAASGEIVVAGNTSSDDGDIEGMSKGQSDVFIMTLDLDGNVSTKRLLGGSGSETLGSISATSDGGIILTGFTYSNDADFKGLKKSQDTNVYDIMVVKYSRDWSIEWIRVLGRGWGNCVIPDDDGSYVLTGYFNTNDGLFAGMFQGRIDVFVIRLDAVGDVVWVKSYGGTETDLATSLALTSDQGIVVVGSGLSNDGDFADMNKGVSDVFAIKLDSDGNLGSASSIICPTEAMRQLVILPNPILTSSMVTCIVEEPSHARLVLVNTLGSVVGTVFDGYLDVGTHQIPLDVSMLSPGSYSLQMTTKRHRQAITICVQR